MRHRRMKEAGRILALAALPACFAAGPARAETMYQLAPGDIVDVSVFGRAELSRKSAIDLDGRLPMPLIGAVAIAGLTTDAAQDVIADRLRQGDLLKGASVLVQVSDYRPVYVKGDVAAPKSYPFMAGMTVRQLISAAGGFGAGGPAAETSSSRADLQADYAAALLEIAALEARLERLRFELDGKPLPPSAQPQAEADRAPGARIASLERRQFETRRSQLELATATLRTLAALTDEQLLALDQQRKQSQDSVNLQQDEVDKARSMLARGLATSNRLTDEQRALAVLKAQLLGTIAQAAETRRLRAELDTKAKDVIEARRAEILVGLQEGALALDKLRMRAGAMRRKLSVAASAQDFGARDDPSLEIHRVQQGRPVVLAATEDQTLMPGDVLEVRLPAPIRLTTLAGE